MSFRITYTDYVVLFAIAVPIRVKYSLQVFYKKFGNTSNTPVPIFYEKLSIYL